MKQELVNAKEFYDKLSELCMSIDRQNWASLPAGSKLTVTDVLRIDVARFIMYLCASDGRLTPEELEVFNYITGYRIQSVQSLGKMINDSGVYSTDFESEPPLIMTLIKRAEDNLASQGGGSDSALPVVVSLFEAIGAVLISADGGVTYNEKRDLNIYIDTMRKFIG